MVKFILIKSPDEWATTKQACRDELVVHLFFSSIYRSLYFYVLSTVLRFICFCIYAFIYIYIYIYITADSFFFFFENSFIENQISYNKIFSKSLDYKL